MPRQHPWLENPLPWMSEILDLKIEKNLFATRRGEAYEPDKDALHRLVFDGVW